MSYQRMLMMANANPPYKTRLQYIRSTGTQYIDSGIKPRNFLEFISEIEASITTPSATTYWGENYGYWIGTVGGQWTIGGGVYLGNASGEKQLAYFKCTTISYTSEAYTSFASVDDGALKTRVGTSGRLQSDGTYYLFALNSFQNNPKLSARLYSQKLYGDGVLVRDFIPVLDNNNVPCLYDNVSRQLFYNDGTGTFNYA